MRKGFLLKAALFFIGAITICQAASIVPNPILSRGKTVYTSSGSVTYLTDDKFGGTTWNAGNNSWLAINVGTGHSQIMVNWDVPYVNWFDTATSLTTCGKAGGPDKGPVNYTLQTSSNSTNGSDGTWTTVATITGNKVTSRAHTIPFTGASWVKMNITTGGGVLDEFEVFDMSNNGTDVWFFPGTSISEMTYKSEIPTQNFADLVHASHPAFNPVMIRGGISCILSVFVFTYISFYLNMTQGAKYWAIEMGTNDAYNNGTSGLATFTRNMQLIIDSCKAAGVKPIIARLISTNPTNAKWQVDPAYETTIDSLTKVNKLIAGPDLYSYFLANPSQHNDDGIHPNAAGAAAIQNLWAQKMDSLYAGTLIDPSDGPIISKSTRSFSLSTVKDRVEFHAMTAGSVRIFSMSGAQLKSMNIPAAGSYRLNGMRGCCIVQFTTSDKSVETMPIVFH